jgi:UDP-N-acetylglucosamine 2-epimerase (non-hydrolysing)
MNKKRFKVLVSFGTRPEAIKLAPLIKSLKAEKIRTVVVITSQHKEMLCQVLDLFGIEADYDLNVMVNNQSLIHVASSVLAGLDKILKKEKPDLIIVQGDTTSTFMGSLAGFYNRIPVGHVEAGLRTYNRHYPFPEEMNRRLTSELSSLHFAPTKEAGENLLKAGINKKDIYITGNTVIDALFMMIDPDYPPDSYDLQRRIILVTVHRRENFGRPIKNVCLALKKIIKSFEDVEIVIPVHYNPNVRKVILKELQGISRIRLMKSMDYKQSVNLMNISFMVLTDSGGIQEEAPALGKPVLVLRDQTERPEGVKAGVVRIVGTEPESILKNAARLLSNKRIYKRMSRKVYPYGDGQACRRIVETIKERF